MTQNEDKYKSIRCYNDNEVNSIVNQLLSEERFVKIL